MKITFPGGVHPLHKNESKQTKNIIRGFLPAQAVIPLSQHIGAVCKPVVSVGDFVKAGSLIGKSEKFISARIYASISGKISKIEPRPHPVIGTCNSVIIESDGKDEKENININADVSSLTSESIIEAVKQAGIVGMGGACFPTHVKLSPPEGKTVDTFILNGAECEPYLSCDRDLMLFKSSEIIQGAVLIMKAAKAKKCIIAIEDNKQDAIKAMKSAVSVCAETNLQFDVVSVPTKYPQGGEKQLIKALLRREVPPNSLPFEVGCLINNVATAFAVYEAVYLSKPLYERVVSICGEAITKPVNVLLRTGTLVSDIINKYVSFKKPPAKIIFGGPMMGICQYTTNVPIIKSTSGILFLSKENILKNQLFPCIKCGRCVDACPVNLMPAMISQASEKERFDIAAALNVIDCMECGSCSYVCPSKIPIVHFIRHAKRKILCENTK